MFIALFLSKEEGYVYFSLRGKGGRRRSEGGEALATARVGVRGGGCAGWPDWGGEGASLERGGEGASRGRGGGGGLAGEHKEVHLGRLLAFD